MYKYFALFLIIAAMGYSAPAFSQHLRLHDIPAVTLDHFQAPVKEDAPFPVYINVRVYYRLDSVTKVSVNKFKLKVITKVEPYRTESFFDRTKVADHAIPQLLNHEQGHVVIGFICGNEVAKQLSSRTYTSDFVNEVRTQFNSLLGKLNNLHVEYDEGSDHSRNHQGQKVWDTKLIEMFKTTYK